MEYIYGLEIFEQPKFDEMKIFLDSSRTQVGFRGRAKRGLILSVG